MNKNNLLFWQPKTDYLRLMSSSQIGRLLLIFLNYAIWIFFLYLSYLLIKNNFTIFWQLLIATLVAEIIEKIGKKKNLWPRPMFVRHDNTPFGLVDGWYRTGAFPSGHTMKATIFLLFLVNLPVFYLPLFLLICLPLLFFRVLVGFHYPIDVVGGAILGVIIWFPSHMITVPQSLNYLPQLIFNTLFFIK